jgi:hypothetical protein
MTAQVMVLPSWLFKNGYFHIMVSGKITLTHLTQESEDIIWNKLELYAMFGSTPRILFHILIPRGNSGKESYSTTL